MVVLPHYLVPMHQQALKQSWRLKYWLLNRSLESPHLPGLVLEMEQRLELKVLEFDPMAAYQSVVVVLPYRLL